MSRKSKKIILGRREEINFPELSIRGITAKIDTGAYSSALHCYDVFEMREGKEKILCFKLLDPSFSEFNNEEIHFRNYTRKKIKNSSGDYEKRFIIKTRIEIGGKTVLTDVSLADRGKMKYPVLVGRKLLSKGFVVDVSKLNITKKTL